MLATVLEKGQASDDINKIQETLKVAGLHKTGQQAAQKLITQPVTVTNGKFEVTYFSN